jgi:hypothetical protein
MVFKGGQMNSLLEGLQSPGYPLFKTSITFIILILMAMGPRTYVSFTFPIFWDSPGCIVRGTYHSRDASLIHEKTVGDTLSWHQ